MDRMIRITKCADCNYTCHTGAFTPNGAVAVCRHEKAPRTYCMKKHTGKDNSDVGFEYKKVAKIDHKEIPKWCPLEAVPT